MHHSCGWLVNASLWSAAKGDYQQHRDEVDFDSAWGFHNGVAEGVPARSHFALISASPQTEIQGKIDDPAVYGNFPGFCKLVKRELVREAARKLLEFTDAESRRVVENIPDEWLTDPSTRSRIAEFVTGRARYVADSIERKLFPQGELNL